MDDSLREKLKCLIFIPIISQTYCDPKSFAWGHEFLPFVKTASADQFGLKVRLPNANVGSRVLPVRIHEIDPADQDLLEAELNGKLRAIDFTYHASGVNRPLTPKDERDLNLHKTVYRDQINKVSNSVKEIILGLQNAHSTGMDTRTGEDKQTSTPKRIQFRTELNRRNVLRASLAYVLLSLLSWKVTSISIDSFDVPEGSIKVVTLILIVFFPISVLLAWLFERSPQGFIRSGSQASLANPFTPDQKKPLTSNAFILLLVATVTALFLLFPRNMGTSETKVVNSADLGPSIAVLPFDDMSPNHDQEYFSNGMMDEVLNHLFKIGGLQVISRTSAMKYKGSKLSLKEIAAELGVAHVLEGSVQKYGDSVRIRVQLINGKTDEHLWVETYTKRFKDIFSIQSSVAQEVAGKLKVAIDPEVRKRIEAIPTVSTEAYNLYLQVQLDMADLEFQTDREEELLEKVIFLDPGFADAYSLLAQLWIMRGGHSGNLRQEQVMTKALPLLRRALKLDRNLVSAHVNLGLISMWYDWDFSSTELEFQEISRLNPSSPALNFFSEYFLASGQFKKSLDLSKKCFDADKNAELNWIMMALAYYYADEPEKALATLEAATNLFENNSWVWLNSIRLHNYCEKYESTIRLYEQDGAGKFIDYSGPYILGHVGIAYFKTGRKDKPIEFLSKLKSMSEKSPVGSPSYFISAIYTAMGEKDKALQSLEKAYSDHEVEMYWLREEPLFKPLHGKPRFEALVEKLFKSK